MNSSIVIADRELLTTLDRRVTHLALVKERYQNIRANVLYARLDPIGRGRIQISAELPLIYGAAPSSRRSISLLTKKTAIIRDILVSLNWKLHAFSTRCRYIATPQPEPVTMIRSTLTAGTTTTAAAEGRDFHRVEQKECARGNRMRLVIAAAVRLRPSRSLQTPHQGTRSLTGPAP